MNLEHLAKLVVGQRHRHGRAARGGVFDPAEADLRIAPGDALIDGGERDVQELGRPADAGGEQRRNLDVEADHPIGMGRIGLDKRRAPFGVARPAEHARLRGDRRRTDRRQVASPLGKQVVSGFRLRVKLRRTTVALAKVVSRTGCDEQRDENENDPGPAAPKLEEYAGERRREHWSRF